MLKSAYSRQVDGKGNRVCRVRAPSFPAPFDRISDPQIPLTGGGKFNAVHYQSVNWTYCRRFAG